jgi:hypothetical protein
MPPGATSLDASAEFCVWSASHAGEAEDYLGRFTDAEALKFLKDPKSSKKVRYGRVAQLGSDRATQPHLFHARDQRGRSHSQEFRCAVSTFDFPVRLLKDDQQVFALAPLQFGFGEKFGFGVARRSRRLPGGSGRGFDRRQIEVQHTATRQDDGSLYDIAQFQDVARPP